MRSFACAAAVLLVGSASGRSRAAEAPTFGLSIGVATENGEPVQDEAWIAAQVEVAEGLLGPLGVHVRWEKEKTLAEKYARLETRSDRDALTSELEGKLVNVMIVASLRDVDDPSLYRMGVCWRHSKSPGTPYLVVSKTARPSVLAHELGHYFGNPHSLVTDNIMSYSRTGGPVFFDDRQASIMRAKARTYLAEGTLIAQPPNRLWP